MGLVIAARGGGGISRLPPALDMPFQLGVLLLALLVADAAKPLKPCPYCDSSVFDYCSDKLLHDACCCLDPFEHHLPHECKLADCSFLHANSCRDHHLITRCCCNRIIHF